MGKNYFIFRHGETHATKTNRWYWHKLYSATIIEEGKPSVLRLAKYLQKVESDYNVSSPFIRCRQTVELVRQATGKNFEFDKRLGEYTIELPINFKRRVQSFIREIENSQYENILICTHSAVISFLLNQLVEKEPTMTQKLKAPRPGVLSVIKNGKLTELDFNNAKS